MQRSREAWVGLTSAGQSALAGAGHFGQRLLEAVAHLPPLPDLNHPLHLLLGIRLVSEGFTLARGLRQLAGRARPAVADAVSAGVSAGGIVAQATSGTFGVERQPYYALASPEATATTERRCSRLSIHRKPPPFTGCRPRGKTNTNSLLGDKSTAGLRGVICGDAATAQQAGQQDAHHRQVEGVLHRVLRVPNHGYLQLCYNKATSFIIDPMAAGIPINLDQYCGTANAQAESPTDFFFLPKTGAT